MLASAAAASVVTIERVPLVPAVMTVVSLVSPVMVITLPFIATSSTVRAVRVPREVIAVCAACVTVSAVPDAFPVSGPVNPVAVSIPVPALYVIPASVLGARSPVALSNNATKEVVSVVSATVIVAGTIFPVPSKDVPPIVLALANAVAVEAFPLTAPVN